MSKKYNRAGVLPSTETKIPSLTSRLPKTTATSTNTPMVSKTKVPKTTSVFSKSSRTFSTGDNKGALCLDSPGSADSGLGLPKKRSRPLGIPQPSTTSLLSANRIGPSPYKNPATSQSLHAKSPNLSGTPRNVLRRKAPSIERHLEHSKTQSSSPLIETNLGQSGTENVLHGSNQPPTPPQQVHTPVSPETRTTKHANYVGPPEFSGLLSPVNPSHFPPTPNFTSSPSTRYTDSPGPWSSRTSTPTSLSSYSPGFTHSSNVGSRLRQPSPSLFRTNPPSYHVSGASYPGATKEVPLFVKAPHWAYTEPARAAGSVLPTKGQFNPPGSLHGAASRSQFEGPSKLEYAEENSRLKADTSDPKQRVLKDRTLKKETQVNESTERFLKPPTTTKFPSRPSRKGTERLELQSSPVIQSNLNFSRLPGHRRQYSGESASGKKPEDTIAPDSVHSKTSSRIPNPSTSTNKLQKIGSASFADRHTDIALSKSRSALEKVTTEYKIPREEAKHGGAKRFGLFPKKSRASPDLSNSVQMDQHGRRGPTAGTGYERYGKYTQRGRRGSIGSNTSRAMSTSTNGSIGTVSRAHSDLDDFLLDRLEPVVITGGSGERSHLARTYSDQSVSGLSTTSTFNTSSLTTKTSRLEGQSSDSLISSPGRFVRSPEPAMAAPTESLFKPSQDSKLKPTIAKRRSFLKPKLFGKTGATGGLSINTDVPNISPPIDSSTTYRTSTSQSDASILAREDTGLSQEVKKKKSQKLGKWNFFQRSHQLRRKERFTPSDLASVTKVPASVSNVPASRPVAHYAILDNDQIESDSLEDILKRIEESPPTEEDIPGSSLDTVFKRQQSVLLPAPPVGLTEFAAEKRPSSPKVFFVDRPTETRELKPKLSNSTRLKSIGRIPPVVSKETRPHKPPLQSFSRPFSRDDMPSIPATSNPNIFSSHDLSSSYMPPLSPSKTENLLPVTQTSSASNYPAFLAPFKAHASPTNDPEFLVLSPRKGSEASDSTSTDSQASLKAITAVVPIPGSKLTEDEVWDEYDDFVDEVLTPPLGSEEFAPVPNTFQMATQASQALQDGLNAMSQNLRLSCQSDCSGTTAPYSSATTNSVHLSRSMILSGLNSSSTAHSPLTSLNETCSDDADDDSVKTSKCCKGPHDQNNVELQTKEFDRQKNAALLDIAERERLGALAQANLRSGSLMTSRWLSFGRVLFSPAQRHVQSEDQSRILVIDGLGNDDWSFYCALTYPTATVYNLSVFVSGTTSDHPAAWDPPSNHRSVYHSNFEHPFPFPKGFFTVAILRFPAACSEFGFKNAISECKRVLRTGGYLEMSILDLDMVNMGSRTRKAVRKLKERVFSIDPNISLKPASDNIQKLLGKRGFQNLNRCTVVVPVAGTILKSSDMSSSTATRITTPNGSQPPHATPSQNPSRPFSDVTISLGELLSDPSPSDSNDEYIAKTVAKVGRWWYTRCYEAPVLTGNLDGSIWADQRLLRECQRHGTGFKLLIAYAQKPSEVTRRTVSV